MPARVPRFPNQSNYAGQINFSLSNERLSKDTDSSDYLHYREDKDVSRPVEPEWVPLYSLRSELKLSPDEQISIQDQLALRGFAATTAPSAVLEANPELDCSDDFAAFVEESREYLERVMKASKVIVWNTTYRRADSGMVEKRVERQKGPELENHAPSEEHVQPPALVAHVDQNAYYGRRVCNMALAGMNSTDEEKRPESERLQEPEEQSHNDNDLVSKRKRVQIINVWRPIRGTVTTSPLAVADYRTMSKDQVSAQATQYGCGYYVGHGTMQKWHFVPFQTTEEILIVKCYDSYQGSDGSALYGAHSAVNIVEGDAGDDQEWNGPRKPRESVEIRFVVCHDDDDQ